MLKTLDALFKKDRGKYTVPRKVQDVIPIKQIWSDGIFMVDDKFAKTYQFKDINYFAASNEDKKKMFLSYANLLNSLDDGDTAKITINNRRIDTNKFEENIVKPLEDDGLDEYRDEYNKFILDKASGANGIVQEKYVTISSYHRNIEDARNYFMRVGTNLGTQLSELGSECIPLDATEKLNILHDFYRPGEESYFSFDPKQLIRHGHDFRNYICPDYIEKKSDYFKFGDKYARVLFLKDYATFIKDEMIKELTDFNRNLMLSLDIIPIPTEEAIKETEARLLGVEKNIADWQRRQNANNNFSATIPYDLELQRNELKELLNDLSSRDQKMMFAVLTLVHVANSKEQLDSDTKTLRSIAGKNMCQLAIMRFQQMDALKTVLPIGVRKIDMVRTLTTESAAVLMPFNVQEIQEDGGIYFGENAISHNLILCNLSKLMNQSMIILGISGSGKSFFAKLLITFYSLFCPDDEIIICDPEGEYTPLVKAFHGSVHEIKAGGKDHINAMDMTHGYADKDENPLAKKSEFIMSLFEQIDKNGAGAHNQSIIDRCVTQLYRECEFTGETPTLKSLRDVLLEQPEEEARKIALSMELFTSGSLDIFAHETNVDTSNRITSYDIHKLGEQLKPVGLLVITDTILNRVTENWKKGKRTHIFIDEFHVVFNSEHSAAFFSSAWRQFRKRNASPCAITQDIEYLLNDDLARIMVSNSECIVMMNQSPLDRDPLAALLGISREQMGYVTNAKAGCGLLRYGGAIVPFINKFPSNTKIYKLITTKPNEGSFGQYDEAC